MSLTEQINEDIKSAMKAREKEKLEALRAIKTALLLEATKDASSTVSSDAEQKLLQKLYKQRIEAAEIYHAQDRADLEAVELNQAAVIEAYLPKQMSDEELDSAIKELIASTGATGPQDMGKVVGKAVASLQGKADGKRVSAAVKRLLS